jgi:hypothetical protein
MEAPRSELRIWRSTIKQPQKKDDVRSSIMAEKGRDTIRFGVFLNQRQSTLTD